MKSMEDRLKQVDIPDISITSHRAQLKQRLATEKPPRHGMPYKRSLIVAALMVVVTISGISAIRPEWTLDLISSAKLIFEKQITNDDGSTTVVRAYQCTIPDCGASDSGRMTESVGPNGERALCKVMTITADVNSDHGMEKLLSGEPMTIATSSDPKEMKIEVTDSGVVMNGKLLVGSNAFDSGSIAARKLLTCASGMDAKTATVDQVPVPEAMNLEQNYPNPFNPETTIRYAVQKDGDVSLKVYNIEGKEVATLATGYQTAGSYSARFNGKDLPSGTYMYRLTTAASTETRQMMLVK
jgi:hypothetical protein